jgi:hypothetical protein
MHTEKSITDGVSGETAELTEYVQREQSSGADRGRRPLRAALVSTIEGEIVPRLLLLRRGAGAARVRPEPTESALDPGDVEELARLLVTHGPGMACEFVEAVRLRGTPYDRIYLDLLSPTARCLVKRWEQQDCSYQELTSGLDALHAVVLEVSSAARSDRRVCGGG